MIKNRRVYTFKILALSGAIMCLSSSICQVYAYNSNSSRKPLEISRSFTKEKNYDILNESLKELVKEGVLSKEKADKVLQYVNENSNNSSNDNKKHRKIFDEMVERKIITEKEAEAIRERKADKKFQLKKERITKALNDLVKDKTINEEQSNKFIEKLEKSNMERKELHKKLRNMTEEERKEYFRKNKIKGKSIIEEMINENIITKEQGESIRKAIFKHDNEKKSE